jgi:hypothetical protein
METAVLVFFTVLALISLILAQGKYDSEKQNINKKS